MEDVLRLFEVKIKRFWKVTKRAKIDPKPWTIVHGFERFLAILNVPIFFLYFASKTLGKTLKEIGSSFSENKSLNKMFLEGFKMTQNRPKSMDYI